MFLFYLYALHFSELYQFFWFSLAVLLNTLNLSGFQNFAAAIDFAHESAVWCGCVDVSCGVPCVSEGGSTGPQCPLGMEPQIWPGVLSAGSSARMVGLLMSGRSLSVLAASEADSLRVRMWRPQPLKTWPGITSVVTEPARLPGSREGDADPTSGWQETHRMCGCLELAMVIYAHNGNTEKGVKYEEGNEQLCPYLEHCLTHSKIIVVTVFLILNCLVYFVSFSAYMRFPPN